MKSPEVPHRFAGAFAKLFHFATVANTPAGANALGDVAGIERRLEQTISNAHDVACGSEELAAAVTDWPSLYHLAPERANLLRPVAHLLRGRILEIGAMGGALTRFLGESGAQVTAIEPDDRFAGIAAERCRDLANVSIYSKTPPLDSVRPFDCIVLADSRVQIAPDFNRVLDACGVLLAPGGALILATGNQFGLHNFAGAPDESSGKPFAAGSAPIGRGRKELEAALLSARFSVHEFLYPFPGWKLPRIIVHPKALREHGDSFADLLASVAPAHDEWTGYARLFSERRLWPAVLRNQLAESLANSFLIVASKASDAPQRLDADILAYIYAVRRRRCYQKQALLVHRQGALKIERRRLYDTPAQEPSPYWQELRDEVYLPGQVYANELYKTLDTPGWTFSDVLEWARPYYNLLLANECSEVRDFTPDSRLMLPPNFTDCTPFNLVRNGDGPLHPFDLEWHAREPLPLDFVLFRGLLYTLRGSITVAPYGSVPTLIIQEMVRDLIRGLGRDFAGDRMEQCWRLEEAFQKCVVGDYAHIDKQDWQASALSIRQENLQTEISIRDAQIQRGRLQVRELLTARSKSEPDIEVRERVLRPDTPERDADAAALRDAVAARDVQILNLRDEIIGLHETLADGEDRRSDLDVELTELRTKLSDRLGELDALSNLLQASTAELPRARNEFKSLMRVASAADDRIAALESGVRAMRGSWSWKVTAPGRVAIDAVRKAERDIVTFAIRLAYRALVLRSCMNGRRRSVIRAIRASKVFDPAYYLSTYPEVAGARLEPLWHYLAKGAEEGRNPSQFFDPGFYASQNPGLNADGLDLLYHFLTQGGFEGRNPSRIFDCLFYLARYPDVVRSGMNPLVHYLQFGAAEGRAPNASPEHLLSLQNDPGVAADAVNSGVRYDVKVASEERMLASVRPPDAYQRTEPTPVNSSVKSDVSALFDRAFYLAQISRKLAVGTDPWDDYLTRGAEERLDPHPLFSTSFYLEHNPDVARANMNPLLHYLQNGAREGRDPNPVFDTSFYLENNSDVASTGVNPLVHYLERGAAEGRDPSPLFHTSQYVKAHPELADTRINPLAHFLRSGAGPKTVVATEPESSPPNIPRSDASSFAVRDISAVVSRRASKQRGTVLCVSHVPGYPPRAGNDYRVFRMLRWLDQLGYSVFLIIAPLPGEPVTEGQLRELATFFPDVVMCERNGEVLYSGPTAALLLPELDGKTIKSYARKLGENKTQRRDRELLNIDRTFSHDALISLILHVRAGFGRCAVLSEYIFMSRFLPLFGANTLKIIDTIDVFSTKQKKVVQHGVADSLALTSAEERERLIRADVVLAIQSAEHGELSEMVPERPVITVGVDFDVASEDKTPSGHNVFYVGSDNAMNVRGLKDFLQFAWPLISRDVPDAILSVAGRIGRAVTTSDPRVRMLGPVDNMEALYSEACVTINPAVAGTGLKIKTVESLCHLRPIVCWPSGIDGMEPALADLCIPVRDWYEFYRSTVRVLTDSRPQWFTAQERGLITDRLSAHTVYAPLCDRLAAFFQNVSKG
jgi:SAM-dependent methyltransferase